MSTTKGTTISQEAPLPVRIEKSKATGRYRYLATDIDTSAADAPTMAAIKSGLIRLMRPPQPGQSPKEALHVAIADVVQRKDLKIDATKLAQIQTALTRDYLGYGPIDVPMLDPNVEDISCDGANVPLYIFHREFGPMETNIIFTDESELDAFVIRMAQMCNREITFARPMLEATLPDGSRLQASLAREITTRGSSFTIRRFKPNPMTPLDLINSKSLSPQVAAYLWLAVESHISILFAGGTASGKTTALNAACVFIPPDEKIVSIEDTRELNLPQQNWSPGVTRVASGASSDSAQNIDMYKLLETALRQRPDYILVGEVRGPEAVTLFQAMATGHATYSTIHADSPLTAVRRLENPPINVPRNLIEALGIIVINGRVSTGSASARRLLEISEIAGVDEDTGDLLTRTVFRWNSADDTYEYLGRSRVLEGLVGTKYANGKELEAEWQRRTDLLEKMSKEPRLDIGELMVKLGPLSQAALQSHAKEPKRA